MKLSQRTFEIRDHAGSKTEVIVHEAIKQFRVYWSSGSGDDIDDWHFASTYEFKITGKTSLDVRLIDSRRESFDETITEVKDGTVQEEALKLHKNHFVLGSLEEAIGKMKAAIEWHSEENDAILMCVFFDDPESLSALRNDIRHKLEALSRAFKYVSSELKEKIGVIVEIKSDGWPKFNMQQEQESEFQRYFHQDPRTFGLKGWGQFTSYPVYKDQYELLLGDGIKLKNPSIEEEISDGIYSAGSTKNDLGLYAIDQDYVLKWLNQNYVEKFRLHDESDDNTEEVRRFIAWVRDLDYALTQGTPRPTVSEPFPIRALAADLRIVTEVYLKAPHYWNDYFDFVQIYTYIYVELVSFAREMKSRHPFWMPKRVKDLATVLLNPLLMIKDGRIPLNAFHEICMDTTKRGAYVDSGVYMLLERRIKDGIVSIAMPRSARYPEMVQEEIRKKLGKTKESA